MSAFSPERCAAALMGGRRTPRAVRRPLHVLPLGLRPTTLQEGIAAQVCLAQLSGSAAPGGFKIGATATKMQAYLGLDGPIAAFMATAGLHGGDSTLTYADFLHPGVECEIAVHLAADLPPRACSAEQAAAAVDLVMTGIEIVENRYPDLIEFGTPSLAADQAFHAAAILGTPVQDWHRVDLEAIEGTISIDGEPVATGYGRDLLGHPMQALAWLAGSEQAAAFGGLRAGQIIMLGSVTQPIWLEGPCTVQVRFDPLPATTLTLV